MPIDKAQRYDAAVAGLRDMVGRATREENRLKDLVAESLIKAEGVRAAREAMQRLLDDLLRDGAAPEGAAKAAAQDADAYGHILDVLKERTGREWSLAQILSVLKDADEVR